LERCTSKQEPPKGPKHKQNIPSLRFEVLDHMSFVENHVVPGLALEDVGISANQRVRRDAHIEVMLVIPPLSKLFAPFRGSMVAERDETGQELLELHFPIQKHTGWDNLP
jgi:hypothetical protein